MCNNFALIYGFHSSGKYESEMHILETLLKILSLKCCVKLYSLLPANLPCRPQNGVQTIRIETSDGICQLKGSLFLILISLYPLSKVQLFKSA